MQTLRLNENNDGLMFRNNTRGDISPKVTKNKSINANGLKMDFTVTADEKRAKAGKEAVKKLLNVFENDMQMDDSLQGSRESVKELQNTKAQAGEELSRLESEQGKLLDEYNVEPDSQEYADFKLLEKKQDLAREGRLDKLTEEEKKRISDIGEPTKFQQDALHVSDMQYEWNQIYNNSTQDLEGELKSITSSEIDRLKTHDMADAVKEATAIKEAASKEIIGMAIKDAKDSIDEAAKEDKEKLEESQDKKDEEEKKAKELEESKSKEEVLNEKSDNNINANSNSNILRDTTTIAVENKLKQNINSLIANQKISSEDATGVIVDETL